jgi:hypothetical protein
VNDVRGTAEDGGGGIRNETDDVLCRYYEANIISFKMSKGRYKWVINTDLDASRLNVGKLNGISAVTVHVTTITTIPAVENTPTS